MLISRRNFLKTATVSVFALSIAGLTACGGTGGAKKPEAINIKELNAAIKENAAKVQEDWKSKSAELTGYVVDISTIGAYLNQDDATSNSINSPSRVFVSFKDSKDLAKLEKGKQVTVVGTVKVSPTTNNIVNFEITEATLA